MESSEVRLSDLQWKVTILRSAASGYVGVYLVAKSEGATYKWTCDAQAVFKLRHKDGHNDQSVVKCLAKHKFSDENLCSGIEEFMAWKEFLEHFVVNNKATFEIEISTNPLKLITTPTSDVSDIDQRYVKFRVSIKKLSAAADAVYTPEIVVGGIRWKIKAQKRNMAYSILVGATKEDMFSNWSYIANITLSLLSHRTDVSPLLRHFENKIRRELCDDWVCGFHLNFDHFKEHYGDGDSATIEVEIKVDDKPDWEIGQPSLSKANLTLECCLCYDCFPSGKIFSTRCGHLFCQSCFKKSIESSLVCLMCKANTSLTELHPVYFK